MKKILLCMILVISQILCSCSIVEDDIVEGADQAGVSYTLDERFFTFLPDSKSVKTYKFIEDDKGFVTGITISPKFIGNSNYVFSAGQVIVTYYFTVVLDEENATPQLISFEAENIILGANGNGESKSSIENRHYAACDFDHVEYKFKGSVTLRNSSNTSGGEADDSETVGSGEN